jgi:phage terminase large subunit GpA-like protein
MDNVKRIYHRSERRRIPSRPCPDCGAVIRAGWKQHSSYVNELDPQGDAFWYCFRATCLTGRNGF